MRGIKSFFRAGQRFEVCRTERDLRPFTKDLNVDLAASEAEKDRISARASRRES